MTVINEKSTVALGLRVRLLPIFTSTARLYGTQRGLIADRVVVVIVIGLINVRLIYISSDRTYDILKNSLGGMWNGTSGRHCQILISVLSPLL